MKKTYLTAISCSHASSTRVFSSVQAYLILINLDGMMKRLRKYKALDIIEAIWYVVKTGCQWAMLPPDYPPWRAVYHHFRSLSARGWFTSFLRLLTQGRRATLGQPPIGEECVMDSQSVRACLPQSEKGIDGNKRIKGIKRHVAVDQNGFVLDVGVTPANVHDSKGAIPLTASLYCGHQDITRIKADLAYRPLVRLEQSLKDFRVECVQSNHGTPEFLPLEGRWVVERTFSWMDNYRRLTRNYEQTMEVARHMFTAACVFFMLRYIR